MSKCNVQQTPAMKLLQTNTRVSNMVCECYFNSNCNGDDNISAQRDISCFSSKKWILSGNVGAAAAWLMESALRMSL